MRVYQYKLHNEPQVSIVCGFTHDRLHMRNRSWGEMEGMMFGMPVEFIGVEWEPSDGEWREGRAKNTALKAVNMKRIIFTNCDITIPAEHVESILSLHAGALWYVSSLRYDEDECGRLTENQHALGDFQAVSAGAFEKIGGFNERMSGWGYCDVDFHNRAVEAITGFQLDDMRVTHNWHPRTMTDTEYRASNERNKALV